MLELPRSLSVYILIAPIGSNVKGRKNLSTMLFSLYAPINGLPQDGGAGQPTGIRLRKAHVGGDFDIHNGPQGGKFDSTAILKSGEDLGMSEWSAILENTQKSFERVSRVQGWLNER